MKQSLLMAVSSLFGTVACLASMAHDEQAEHFFLGAILFAVWAIYTKMKP